MNIGDVLGSWTTRRRILACMIGTQTLTGRAVVTASMTREGIADRIGIHHSMVSRHLKSLIQEGLVKTELHHVKGHNRRRKISRLTSAGARSLSQFHEDVLRCEVLAEFDGGSIERRVLRNLEHLLVDLTLLDPLSLVEWLEKVGEPIPLTDDPLLLTSRADDRMVHWILTSAGDRAEAVERASILLNRKLNLSSLMRWQLELLASEARLDGWRPDARIGPNQELEEFLLSGEWHDVPVNKSPLLNACKTLLAGSRLAQEQDSLIRMAVERGAPREWLRILERQSQ